MAQKKNRKSPEVDAASMADIAFLLLIFFLVATTFPSDKGISMTLPPKPDDTKPKPVPINERNVYNILVNARGDLLVEDQPMQLRTLKEAVTAFVKNNGVNPDLSDSPKKAVVSLKADRGTSFETYLQVLDQVQAAYHQIRSKELGWTVSEYLSFDLKNEKDKGNIDIIRKYGLVKEKYPMLISEADPNTK